MLAMAVYSTLIIVALFVWTPCDCKKFNGLGFKLPGSKFCQPCYVDAEALKQQPTNELDSICKSFAEKIFSSDVGWGFYEREFIQQLGNIDPLAKLIAYSYARAKSNFGLIHNTSYDTFITGTENFTSKTSECIQIIAGGNGFYSSPPPSSKNPNLIYYYDDGAYYERKFLQATMDYWARAYCSSSTHQIFLSAAVKRLKHLMTTSLDWDMNRRFPTSKQNWPTFNNTFSESCGKQVAKESPLYPKRLNTDCAGVLCEVPQKTQRTGEHHNSPDQLETEECSAEHSNACSVEKDSDRKSLSQIYINEIQPSDCSENELDEFIELRKFPYTRLESIGTSKLIAFCAITGRLLTVINMHHLPFNENGYLSIDKNDFVSVASDVQKPHSVLPCGEKGPIVVALLEKKEVTHDVWIRIKLKDKMENRQRKLVSIDLTTSETFKDGSTIDYIDIIKKTVADFYIYGQIINNYIHPRVKEALRLPPDICNFILAPANFDENERGLSLGQCEEPRLVYVFDFKHFKLGNPSKSEANDCQTKPYFQIEKTEQTLGNKNNVGVTYAVAGKSKCPSLSNVNAIVQRIEFESSIIRKEFDANYNNPFFPAKFSSVDFTLLVDMYKETESTERFYPLEKVTSQTGLPLEHQSWRCAVCYKRMTECGHTAPKSLRNDKLTTQDGVILSSSDWKALEQLNTHLHGINHYTSILQSVQNDLRTKAAEKRVRFDVFTSDNIVMANIFNIAFTIVKTNTALDNSKDWFAALKKIQANIGTSSHSKQLIRSMIIFISTEGITTILNDMKIKRKPFSVLLDASSDKSNTHYISLYFQTTEGGYAIPYFVALLKMKASFSSEAYMDALDQFLSSKDPSFRRYFFSYCVGLITDGAKVMEKLGVDFRAWILRNSEAERKPQVYHLLCLSHKLNLITRNSIVPLKTDADHGKDDCLLYFQEVEKRMQQCYTWIKHGAKRLGDYREVIEEFHLPRVELKAVHIERWVASEHATIKAFLSAWIALLKTTERISNDAPRHNKKVRDEAKKLHTKLMDKTFLITVVFMQDYTATFKTWSLATQTFGSLLVEQHQYFVQLMRDLNELEQISSPVLTSFLTSCTCSASRIGCTLEEFETSKIVSWRGQQFTDTDNTAPKLTILAPEIIRKTKLNIEKYMPAQLIQAASAFNPSNLPAGYMALKHQNKPLSDADPIPLYARAEVEYFANLFGIPTADALKDWAHLLVSILTSNAWEELRRDMDASSFWARCLNNNDMKWTAATRFLIRSVLTISAGTSVIESSFSVFNVQKNQRRSRMSDDLLTALMSIIVNGPEKVEDFAAFTYADRFIQIGHRLPNTDEPNKKCPAEDDTPRSPEPEIPDEEENDDEHDVFSEIADHVAINDRYKEFQQKIAKLPKKQRVHSVLM